MSELNFQLFDPTLFMDSDSSPEDGCDHHDFGFAFNDSNFSDRVLRIYILSESTQPPFGISRPLLSCCFSYFPFI
ncbi:hypothetical protein Hdeb2414_s0008g00268781 [Helianthus debilis subsp. tardiflorus]